MRPKVTGWSGITASGAVLDGRWREHRPSPRPRPAAWRGAPAEAARHAPARDAAPRWWDERGGSALARQGRATTNTRPVAPGAPHPRGGSPMATATHQPTPPFPKQTLDKPGLESELDPRPRYKAPRYKGSGKLEGKKAIITGGDSGIGRAVAVLFAREGADVTILHLPEEASDARETCAAVEEEGRKARAVEADVREFETCRRVVDEAVSAMGGLDILVNNAAFQQHQDGIEDISIDQWDRTFRTNIYGYFHMVKAALPHMERGAAIINTGSITGLEGVSRLIDYSSTKGAIHAFTKALAQNLVERGIRVNCVAPGPVWTPLNPAERTAEEVAHFGEGTPYGRPAQPEEMAPAYVFFASEADSSYITGDVLEALGGSTTAG
ncbi:MAG: SDR family oxidoreductase [Deltaproteobacteria bacterium]|nr:SDR family oxidoreductase [Deltaproteobacteria bacterium]MCB9786670.1 SDR family oxidoreductase [Deltaproteobacteria bacterium]